MRVLHRNGTLSLRSFGTEKLKKSTLLLLIAHTYVKITYHRYLCYSHSVKLSPSVYAKQNTIVSVFDYFSAVYIRVQLIVQYVVQVVCSR